MIVRIVAQTVMMRELPNTRQKFILSIALGKFLKVNPCAPISARGLDVMSAFVLKTLMITRIKGMMKQMAVENGFQRLEYLVPTRGLLGYRSEFINDTHGEGTMVRRFSGFEPWKGEIQGRINGVAVAQEEGNCTAYAIFTIQERVQMFVKPQDHVYEGQLVGMNARSDDMVVNPCRAKKATNMRAAASTMMSSSKLHRQISVSARNSSRSLRDVNTTTA